MINLALAILSSMAISVLMRLSSRHTSNSLTVLAANYMMCTAAAAFLTGWPLFPSGDGTVLTLSIGTATGVLYLLGFVLLRWNISRNGLVLPATFQKLGVIVPTLAAVLLFGETPRVLQLIGVVVAIAAILIMQERGESNAGSMGGLVLLLLAGGCSDVMSKVFEQYGNAAQENHFLLSIFVVALVLCIILCIVKKQGVTLPDVLYGFAIGIPNYMSARFLLRALMQVPAVVVYPTFSVGTIVLVTLVGVVFFHERLDRRKLLALGMILVSLVLLNV
ncbi:MAG: hypothetical protein IJZ74_02005 [Clostridia bacterium]|nr:hypothetical protein [Clostridia bacterium]